MGAETTVHVLVAKVVSEWIEVSAVTLFEASEKAKQLEGVSMVIAAQYEPPDSATEERR